MVSVKRDHCYLVQRGHWKKEINATDIKGIDDVVSFDYMGAAEFEWGSLPQSLKRMLKHQEVYEFIKLPKRKDAATNQLYIYAPIENAADYKEMVRTLIKKPYTTKMWNGLHEYMHSSIEELEDRKTNFWWDIENDFFIFFGEEHFVYIQKAMEGLAEKWREELFPPQPKSLWEKIKNCFKKKTPN